MNNRGFTLIELLVVVAIIGVLSSVILVSLTYARNEAYDSQRVSNLLSVQQALEIYATDNNGQYPDTDGNWSSACTSWGGTTQNGAIPGLVPADIPELPIDTQTDGANVCCYVYMSGMNGDTNDYKYMIFNCPHSHACNGNSEAYYGGLPDPERPTSAYAVYTTGATNW